MKVRRIVVMALAWLSCTAVHLGAQLPATFTASFDRADREAQQALWTLRCAQGVSQARARGAFGPADSLGHSGHCLHVDGHSVGVFLDVDSATGRAARLSEVDMSSGVRRTGPVDTSAVLALDRAELDAQERGVPSFARAKRMYSPVSFRFDGDSIQVWLVPIDVLQGKALGGEHGYVYSPDGRALAREIDAFAAFRPFAIPDSGTVQIWSDGNPVPSFSELLLANMLVGGGRRSIINSALASSVLEGNGNLAFWIQLPPARRNPAP